MYPPLKTVLWYMLPHSEQALLINNSSLSFQRVALLYFRTVLWGMQELFLKCLKYRQNVVLFVQKCIKSSLNTGGK